MKLTFVFHRACSLYVDGILMGTYTDYGMAMRKLIEKGNHQIEEMDLCDGKVRLKESDGIPEILDDLKNLIRSRERDCKQDELLLLRAAVQRLERELEG